MPQEEGTKNEDKFGLLPTPPPSHPTFFCSFFGMNKILWCFLVILGYIFYPFRINSSLNHDIYQHLQKNYENIFEAFPSPYYSLGRCPKFNFLNYPWFQKTLYHSHASLSNRREGKIYLRNLLLRPDHSLWRPTWPVSKVGR